MGTAAWWLPAEALRAILNLPDDCEIVEVDSGVGLTEEGETTTTVFIWISHPDIPKGQEASLEPVFEHSGFGSRLISWGIEEDHHG